MLSTIKEEDAAERIDLRVCGGLKNLSLKFVSGDAAEPAVYQKIELDSFHSIVILADDLEGIVDADTRTLRVLLRLSRMRQPGNRKTHTMVELHDAPLGSASSMSATVVSSRPRPSCTGIC